MSEGFSEANRVHGFHPAVKAEVGEAEAGVIGVEEEVAEVERIKVGRVSGDVDRWWSSSREG